MAAARRAGRGPAGDTCLRGGAPRPQARQRAAGRRRAAGDRLRHLPRRRRNRADGGRSGVRHAGFHVTRAGRGTGRRPRERRVRARVRGRLRGGRRGSVRHRHGGRHLVPRGALRARPGRDTAAAAGGDRRLPGQGPGRPPHAAGALRRDLQRHGRDRAVRGGVLAVVGGRPDRRLSGQARAGNARRQQARGSRGVLLGSGSTSVHPPTTPSDPGTTGRSRAARTGTRRRLPLAVPVPGSQAVPRVPGRRPSGLAGDARARRDTLGLRVSPAPGYPQPQGYGGGQASQPPYAPPRGYLPASGGPASPGPPPSAGYPPNGGPAGYPRRTGWDHEGRLPRCPPAWPPRSG